MNTHAMKNFRSSSVKVAHSRGVSLIIVLIMMVIIGLTAASAMRNATSNEKATNNLRLDNVAQQYAEVALRYCEGQLQLPDAQRVATLRIAVIPTVATNAVAAWEQAVTWVGVPGSGGGSATRTSVPVAYLSGGNASYVPIGVQVPECVAEIQAVPAPSTLTYTVVTARGFSPDYARNAAGQTTNGAVVWLQSVLNL